MLRMSYDWIVPGRLIYTQFEGEQTLEELQQVVDILIPEFEVNGFYPYTHVIYDNENTKIMYSALQAIKIMAPAAKHPKSGWFVQLNPTVPLATNIIANTVFQMARARFRTVKTLAEATRFLNDVDSTLPDLSTADFSLPPMRDIYDWPILQPNPETN